MKIRIFKKAKKSILSKNDREQKLGRTVNPIDYLGTLRVYITYNLIKRLFKYLFLLFEINK